MNLPLEGIRVVDLSRLLPGPLATQILADFGADVIKVEDTGAGDGFRHVAPVANGVGFRHLALNRNKRSVSLNLKAPEGQAVFKALVRSSHVVLEQFRPGVMARLGLDYATLRREDPALVYASLSGFGQDGPNVHTVAHDPNYLALTGILSLLGQRDGPPALSGVQMADVSGAYMVAMGILMGVRAAEWTGQGTHVDVALFDSALAGAQTAAAVYFGSGRAPRRGEERFNGGTVYSGIYETRDGGHVTVAAIEPHFWEALCRGLGREDWLDKQQASGAEADEIRAALAESFRSRTRAEWAEWARGKDVCVTPVLSLGEALESEQVRHRELVLEGEHPVAGPYRALGTPIKMAGVKAGIRRHAPALGADTRPVLAELGYSNEQIATLLAAGVVKEATR